MTTEADAYFALGQTNAGVLHASRGDWGPALCDQPLLVIDERHKYSPSDLAGTNVCPTCLAVVAEPTEIPPLSA